MRLNEKLLLKLPSSLAQKHFPLSLLHSPPLCPELTRLGFGQDLLLLGVEGSPGHLGELDVGGVFGGGLAFVGVAAHLADGLRKLKRCHVNI